MMEDNSKEDNWRADITTMLSGAGIEDKRYLPQSSENENEYFERVSGYDNFETISDIMDKYEERGSEKSEEHSESKDESGMSDSKETEAINAILKKNGFNGDYLKRLDEDKEAYLERVGKKQQFDEADEQLKKETGKGFSGVVGDAYVEKPEPAPQPEEELNIDEFEDFEQDYSGEYELNNKTENENIQMLNYNDELERHHIIDTSLNNDYKMRTNETEQEHLKRISQLDTFNKLNEYLELEGIIGGFSGLLINSQSGGSADKYSDEALDEETPVDNTTGQEVDPVEEIELRLPSLEQEEERFEEPTPEQQEPTPEQEKPSEKLLEEHSDENFLPITPEEDDKEFLRTVKDEYRTPNLSKWENFKETVKENKTWAAALAGTALATYLLTLTNYGQQAVEDAQDTKIVKATHYLLTGEDPVIDSHNTPTTPEKKFNTTYKNITFHTEAGLIEYLMKDANTNDVDIFELEKTVNELQGIKRNNSDEITELKIDVHKSSVYNAVDLLVNNGILNDTEAAKYKNLTKTQYPDEILPLLDAEIDNHYKELENNLDILATTITDLKTDAIFSDFYSTDALYETSINTGTITTHSKISELRSHDLGLLGVTMDLTGENGTANITKLINSNESFGQFIKNQVENGATKIILQQGYKSKLANTTEENKLLVLLERTDGDEIEPLRSMMLNTDLSEQLIEGLTAEA